ncbi:hypothetical protein ACFV2D_37125 [Streptomyces capillispiralis]|uniref:hypothetical protein n=1 Tax=Streptomyces capillispiralis TaxID=68182 RepID=UPI003673ABF9
MFRASAGDRKRVGVIAGVAAMSTSLSGGQMSDGSHEKAIGIVAATIRDSGEVIVGGDYALYHHGIRPDKGCRIDIYYTGNDPDAETLNRLKERLETLKDDVFVSVSKCPNLDYFAEEFRPNEPLEVGITSYEDTIRFQLKRLAGMTANKGNPQGGWPIANDYYNLYMLDKNIGQGGIDALLAASVHSVDLTVFKVNLERLDSELLLFEKEFRSFEKALMLDVSFRRSLVSIHRAGFPISEAAWAYAKSLDAGKGQPQLESKVKSAIGLRIFMNEIVLSTVRRTPESREIRPPSVQFNIARNKSATPSEGSRRRASNLVSMLLRNAYEDRDPQHSFPPVSYQKSQSVKGGENIDEPNLSIVFNAARAARLVTLEATRPRSHGAPATPLRPSSSSQVAKLR